MKIDSCDAEACAIDAPGPASAAAAPTIPMRRLPATCARVARPRARRRADRPACRHHSRASLRLPVMGTYLVTGSSTGIGRATAEALAGAGHTVLAGVRKEQDAPPDTEAVILDVTNA